MGRERKEFVRLKNVRKTNNLFIIATEGEKTEVEYFEQFKDIISAKNLKVYIKLIPSKSGRSSPKSILENLDTYNEEYKLLEEDSLWIVIDRDHWKERDISDVAAKCQQKSYRLALSNPCFEIWLILHFADVSQFSIVYKRELELNKRINSNRTSTENELRKYCHNYKKNHFDFSSIFPNTKTAVQNAKRLITNPRARWPINIGTDIYKLIEELMK
jgi:hypothetical protein